MEDESDELDRLLARYGVADLPGDVSHDGLGPQLTDLDGEQWGWD